MVYTTPDVGMVFIYVSYLEHTAMQYHVLTIRYIYVHEIRYTYVMLRALNAHLRPAYVYAKMLLTSNITITRLLMLAHAYDRFELL